MNRDRKIDSSKTFKVLVTSPHRICKSKNTRDCDIVAGKAADIITKKLKAIGIRGNEHREDHDLNRSWSRDTLFRQTLSSSLQTYSGSAIILDVHSFPNYYYDEAGDINFFKKEEIPPDIVIMTGPNDKFKEISISYELFQCLKNTYNVKIISDINVLDILNQSHESNVSGVLLEFNEKFASSPEELSSLCNNICICINRLVNS